MFVKPEKGAYLYVKYVNSTCWINSDRTALDIYGMYLNLLSICARSILFNEGRHGNKKADLTWEKKKIIYVLLWHN